jgi:hypothetical protein
MKQSIFVVVLIGAGIVGLGFYQGWFHAESDSADGKSKVTVSVDKDKFQKDEKKAVAEVKDVGRQIKEKVAGPSEKKDTVSASSSHDGKVVTITSDKLVMTNMDDKEKHTHPLGADIKITCDGNVCKAADLKPGMRIRVTVGNADTHTATRIEALDNNRDFEKGV